MLLSCFPAVQLKVAKRMATAVRRVVLPRDAIFLQCDTGAIDRRSSLEKRSLTKEVAPQRRAYYSPIHVISRVHSCIQKFIRSFVRSFLRACVRSFIHSSNQSNTHSVSQSVLHCLCLSLDVMGFCCCDCPGIKDTQKTTL